MVLVLVFVGFMMKKGPSGSEPNMPKGGAAKEIIMGKMCDLFPKELVERAIGKPIVRVEEGTLVDPTCDYYTAYSETYDHTPYGDHPGGPHVVAVYDTKDFAKDRISNEKSGTVYETDASIGMDNFVMRNNVKKIWQTALSLGGERYIRIKFVDDAVTGDDLVKIAREFVTKIKGDPSFVLGGGAPADNANTGGEETSTAVVTGESEQAVASDFFAKLSTLKIQDALAMMDADEGTKQAWGVNFNTLEKLEVKKIEEIYKEEWTATRQTFKVELEVVVKPAGEQMGWQNGTNYRWITLEKNASGQWLVHELANNP